jgi:hypothetical protein
VPCSLQITFVYFDKEKRCSRCPIPLYFMYIIKLALVLNINGDFLTSSFTDILCHIHLVNLAALQKNINKKIKTLNKDLQMLQDDFKRL